MSKKSVIGIDLGTSSVKVIKRYQDGTLEKAKASYKGINPKAWWEAICNALSQLDLSDVAAVGLSSQVGTYIVDEEYVISWNEGAGAEELKEVMSCYDVETFIKEISMPHPSIVSYPSPRLRYIKKKFPEVKKVGMPKDFICEKARTASAVLVFLLQINLVGEKHLASYGSGAGIAVLRSLKNP